MSNVIPDRATVKMVKGKASTVNGIATILVKIPSGGRKIAGGLGWFETRHQDDFFSVYITDEDNLLGQGIGYTVESFTDVGVPADNQGWYIPNDAPYIKIDKLAEFGDLPENFYIKVIGTKGDLSSDTLRINIHWGKAI